VAAVAAAGADDLVIGRALFGSSDRAATVRQLRAALDLARCGPVAA
jgi:pentose-5-phosphate-3-epimerase